MSAALGAASMTGATASGIILGANQKVSEET